VNTYKKSEKANFETEAILKTLAADKESPLFAQNVREVEFRGRQWISTFDDWKMLR